VRILGVDVRHAPGVAQDGDRLVQSRQLHLSLRDRERAASAAASSDAGACCAASTPAEEALWPVCGREKIKATPNSRNSESQRAGDFIVEGLILRADKDEHRELRFWFLRKESG